MAGVSDASAVLAQIRDYQSRIAEQRDYLQQPARPYVGGLAPVGENFSGLVTRALRSGIEQVNDLQSKSTEMVNRFESGEDVPLTDVVLAMQKSSIAFEATLQVRNKVMKAYEDIMNMPV